MCAARSLHSFYNGTKIVAIGKNYAKHVVEMGSSTAPAVPIFFLKPNSSVIHEGSPIVLPAGIGEVHHEVELGVVISRTAKNVKAADWQDYVGGYCLALDLTARDLQAAAKKAGTPWTQSKCYDTFTPLSHNISVTAVPDPHALQVWLKVDGETRQIGHTKDMIFRIPELLEYVSHSMTLEAGDLIITGTPEGVGPIAVGNTVSAGLKDVNTGKNLIEMAFQVE